MNGRDYVEKCIRSLRLPTGAATHDRILSDVLRVHAEANSARVVRRSAVVRRLIMTNWMLKISGLGIVIVLAVVLFAHFGGGATVLADVLAHIQQESYSFTLTIRSGQASSVLRGTVYRKGQVRFDNGVGEETQSTIVDLESRKRLLLSHQSKTARYVEGPEELTNTGSDRLLLLCSRPVESLWHLRDGTEDDLGEGVIGGTKAHGFRIVHEDEYFRNEITLWAGRRSGWPLRVEIASLALKPPRDRLDFILENFVTESDLDEGLFSLEVPPGYALSAQADSPDTASERQGSDEAGKVIKALQLWPQGRVDEALDLLLDVDWDKPMVFVDEPCIFSLTEQAVASLGQTDRDQLMPVILDQCNQLRKICFALVERAKAARSVQDYTKAETCLTTVLHLGELANRDPGGIFIAQLTGIAAQKLSLVQLKPLYLEMNAAEKLVDIEMKIQQVDAEHQALAQKARGQQDPSAPAR
jgi:outer membrane lipoprotein-sorting protein